jgi:integrase
MFAVDALRDHRAAMLAEGNIKAPMFCVPGGGFLQKGNVYQRSFIPMVTAAGVQRIRLHDLRHTHATLLLQAGENVKVVSERLGHASITITLETYSHVLPTMQKAAAEKLQRLLG